MAFVLLTLGLLVVLFVIMVATARMFRDHSVADLLDWKPTRSPEVEAQNEVDDVRQMIEAQNEYRRKRGAKEITEADVHLQAQEDEALRARGRGPFAQGGDLDDETEEEPPPPKPRKKGSRTSKPKARSSKAKPKPKPRASKKS
jgi:Na+-transporting methylmalonyl-CoA/oxaloacetate decarboxylase gamma subunit